MPQHQELYRNNSSKFEADNAGYTGYVVLIICLLFGRSVAYSEEPVATIASEEPVATIAVLSNPYITTLPAEKIVDERNTNRGFLAQTGPASIKKSIKLINQLHPDVAVVLGSQTWTGTTKDCEAAVRHLQQIKVPLYTVPGSRDRLSDSINNYQKYFKKYDVSQQVKTINNVQLIFAEDLHASPITATSRITKQLANLDTSAGRILFSGKAGEFIPSQQKDSSKAFWSLIDRYQIAVRLDPVRYNHQTNYTKTLPIWSVGSTAWSARGAVTVLRVYQKRIEISEVRDVTQPAFMLTVPNPVKAARMQSAAEDPYRSPSYSLDLADKPLFTFGHISDPQFDRERNRETLIQKAKAGIEDLNRLKPEMVFITGDLVNNNLPEEWKMFNTYFSKLVPTRYDVPGNHDVLFNYDFIESGYSSAPQKNPQYAKIVKEAVASAANEGFRGPTALYEKYTKSKPQQLITHKNCAFITVSFLTQRADESQLKLLRTHLEQAKKYKHVFVLAHYPSLPAFGNNVQPQLGGNEVLSLLQQHKVVGYLFGHRHRNGFQMHDRTAHVLADNMGSILLYHVFDDRIVIGRKRVGAPLYEKLVISAQR